MNHCTFLAIISFIDLSVCGDLHFLPFNLVFVLFISYSFVLLSTIDSKVHNDRNNRNERNDRHYRYNRHDRNDRNDFAAHIFWRNVTTCISVTFFAAQCIILGPRRGLYVLQILQTSGTKY